MLRQNGVDIGQISIHAPPRGATYYSCLVVTIRKFQFTPLREGRRRGLCRGGAGWHFNSRPSARGDFYPLRTFGHISHFNSRPSARGDMSALGVTGTARLFQFTPLREGRPAAQPASPMFCSFQFTPLREGRHRHIGNDGLCLCISIHAPPRGATSTRISGTPKPSYFNSRPSARGDM